MTGIAAIFGPAGGAGDRLGRMVAAMADRAIDGTGTWSQDRFALGACILRTTAESFEADQPHTSADGTLALVMDGYLTNCDELRRDLTERGVPLRGRSDEELVLHAYEHWGEDCAARIEGEFAFVIADRRRQRLYAARDHQGLRPLYYFQDGEKLLVASDIRAIIAALETYPEPDWEFLSNVVLRQFWLRARTPWAGLVRLPQSCWMLAEGTGADAPRISQYYELPTEITRRYASEDEYVEHYRAMLFDIVRRTSRTHAPLACAVSGGLDSSALFCVAHRLDEEGRLPAPELRGYTMRGIEGSGSYELPYALATAEHVGRPLTQAPLFRPDEPWFTAQCAIDCDVPIPTNGAMAITIERQVAADGCRAFMHGTGGDEWLQGGGQYYREFLEDGDASAFLAALRSDSQAYGWRRTIEYALRTGANAVLPHGLRRRLRARKLQRKWDNPDTGFWLTNEWRRKVAAHEAAYYAALPDHLGTMLKRNTFSNPYGDFAKSRMQLQRAQSGIEGRYPMYSRQFIEFSTTTPDYIKRKGFGRTKHTHRLAMRGILPDMVTDRVSKVHFESDAVDRQFGEFLDKHGKEALARLCSMDGLSRLIGEQRTGGLDGDWSWEIWSTYAVAAFLTMHRDRGFRLIR